VNKGNTGSVITHLATVALPATSSRKACATSWSRVMWPGLRWSRMTWAGRVLAG
jgi:hypothetical protein